MFCVKEYVFADLGTWVPGYLVAAVREYLQLHIQQHLKAHPPAHLLQELLPLQQLQPEHVYSNETHSRPTFEAAKVPSGQSELNMIWPGGRSTQMPCTAFPPVFTYT
ncbi:hypothetical protein AOLI_G00216600 [Acnodon oligacanthus]